LKLDQIKIDNEVRTIVGVKSRDRIKKRIFEGRIQHPDGKAKESGKWLLKSRHLASGINYKVTSDKVLLSVEGPARKYAKILHEGGTIRPKKAKFLAIPLTPAARVKKPRDFDKTFIKKGVIFRKEGKKITALYVLKKSVEIPAFDYLKLKDDDLKIIVKVVKNHMVRKYGG